MGPTGIPQTLRGRTQSRPVGDVVLASLPPYFQIPWLAGGIPLLATKLEMNGIKPRIPRFLDKPFDSPQEVVDLMHRTLWGDPSVEERLSSIRTAAEHHQPFFENLLERLLAGPERVFGFSVWRINADVVLEVARQLKERRPDAHVILGGPETSECGADLQLPWIDAVVVGPGDALITPVMRAFLDGRPTDAGSWENVWLNPALGPRRSLLRKRAEPEQIPKIDYSLIVPLHYDDPEATIPVILNMGCPFHCSFCVNKTTYPDLEWGAPERVVQEMLQISQLWKDAFEGVEAPRLSIQICDAALNAQPEQFDTMCRLMIAADWPVKPHRITGLIILDGRMTQDRVRLATQAGLRSSYFGLETASPRLRRNMKKPGSIEQVAEALRNIAAVGECDSILAEGRSKLDLACGLIVGWPDETEEEFYESVQFLDWATTLGVFEPLLVMPLLRTPAAMDEDLLGAAGGARKGALWNMASPGGSPAVRARRFFYLFEHFNGLVNIESPIPNSFIAKEMLSGDSAAFWDRWIARRGHDGDLARRSARQSIEVPPAPPPEPIAVLPPPPPPPPPEPVMELPTPDPRTQLFVAEFKETFASVAVDAAGQQWTLQDVAELPDRVGAVLRFTAVADNRIVALAIEPLDAEKRAYARTARFNLSYLSDDGLSYDRALIEREVAALQAAEKRPPAAARL